MLPEYQLLPKIHILVDRENGVGSIAPEVRLYMYSKFPKIKISAYLVALAFLSGEIGNF